MNGVALLLVGMIFLAAEKLSLGQTNIFLFTNQVVLSVSTNQAATPTNFVKKSGAEIDKEFDAWTAPQRIQTNIDLWDVHQQIFTNSQSQTNSENQNGARGRPANKFDRLRSNFELAKRDCDLAKTEYDNYMVTLGLSQDVTLRLESSADYDDYVTVDIYLTYNSFDFMSRQDLREQTKNIVGTLLLKYLTIHFPKSHISAHLHEKSLNPNWDK